MRSAFGVDHGDGVVFAKDERKAEQHRKTANALTGIGGTAAAVGGATGGISIAEHKGKDPMGFIHTMGQWKGRPISPGGQARILRATRNSHAIQAGGAGLVAAGSLGLAHSYRKARKRELAKSAHGDRTRTTAATAVGGAAVGGGALNAGQLASAAHESQRDFRQAHHAVALHRMGAIEIPKKDLATALKTRRISGRVTGIKGAGALASAGVAGLGGKVIYDATKKRT